MDRDAGLGMRTSRPISCLIYRADLRCSCSSPFRSTVQPTRKTGLGHADPGTRMSMDVCYFITAHLLLFRFFKISCDLIDPILVDVWLLFPLLMVCLDLSVEQR